MKKVVVVGMLLLGIVSAKSEITFGYGNGPNGPYNWNEERIGNMTFGHGYGPDGSFSWTENRIGPMTFGYGRDSGGNSYSWDRFDFGWSGSNRSGGFLDLEDDDDDDE